jgi:hypothetical protein
MFLGNFSISVHGGSALSSKGITARSICSGKFTVNFTNRSPGS